MVFIEDTLIIITFVKNLSHLFFPSLLVSGHVSVDSVTANSCYLSDPLLFRVLILLFFPKYAFFTCQHCLFFIRNGPFILFFPNISTHMGSVMEGIPVPCTSYGFPKGQVVGKIEVKADVTLTVRPPPCLTRAVVV